MSYRASDAVYLFSVVQFAIGWFCLFFFNYASRHIKNALTQAPSMMSNYLNFLLCPNFLDLKI